MYEALTILGLLIGLVGWVWLVLAGFVENFIWGIGIIVFSPLCLVFSLLNWPEYKVPTFLYVGGIGLYLLGQAFK